MNMTPVTRATLPPLESYLEKIREIFSCRYLTNNGKNVQELEQALTGFLEVPHLTLCTNGTLALQLALRLLNLNGKPVVTTPFSYVATVSALLWEGCEPVFADIDPRTLCISPEAVEACLDARPDIAGVLPVHVYGNACDVTALEDICRRHGVALLYDAAHAFGCRIHDRGLLSWGDASAGSFHATKLFHTVEGGCVACRTDEAQERLSLLRAFGHINDDFICLGINAKMSEVHAAMGLCMLPLLPELIRRRAELCAAYDALLDLPRSGLAKPAMSPDLEWNYAYYPVIFPDNKTMMRCLAAFGREQIHPRRYFYPSLNTLPYVSPVSCPVSEDIVQRVACLPLWPDMGMDTVERVAAILTATL